MPEFDQEWLDRVRMVAAETDSPAGSLWWLSFCDGDRPEGEQFLGACMVAGDNLVAALARSHRLGINPGGSVEFRGPFESSEVPDGWPVDRLLTRAEIEQMEAG